MTERDNQEVHQTSTTSSSGTDADTTTIRTQAAFINKLYKMLQDSTIQALISWSDRGDLFSVSNPTAFSKTVLPQYFKHNNWQSFVRQLNSEVLMYGFHKVNDMIHSNLTSDNQTWEFKHPQFRRGEIEELQNIKRKSTKPILSSLPSRIPTSAGVSCENDEDIYCPMYKHILHIEDRLHHVTKSYEILKNETNSLRSLLTKQQETIGEFAVLFSDALDEDVNIGGNMSSSKREAILSKLNDLQNLLLANNDNASQASSSSNSQIYPSANTTPTGMDDNQRHSFIQHSSSPTNTRSFEQFLFSQQHNQDQNPSHSGQSSSETRQHYNNNDSQYHYQHYSLTLPPGVPSPVPHTALSPSNLNRRMGFGKESHLLNPEPNIKDAQRGKRMLIEDKFIKKRRTE